MPSGALHFKEKEWHIQNTWYQQYKQNDKHDWHCHNESNWSNIYYLELPKTTETLSTSAHLILSGSTAELKTVLGVIV